MYYCSIQLRVWLLVAVAALALSCDGGTSRGEQCEIAEDCPAGQFCDAGVCRDLCHDDTDCEPAERCDAGVCQDVANPACTEAVQCQTPTECQVARQAACVAGQCQYTCADPCVIHTDCPAGDYCQAGGSCAALVPDGSACAPEGSDSCASGYCDDGLCCAGGDCCSIAADCPPLYSEAPRCTDPTSTTDCQGTRRDPACNNSVCSTAEVDDDSACGGVQHACPDNLAPVACTSATDQPAPACPAGCTAPTDCLGGYTCASGSCVLIGGVGAPCTGAGQGSCDSGLKCENGVCCAAGGPTCCAQASHCSAGLACNTTAAACLTSCNDYEDADCADPATTYCLSNACVPKKDRAATCGYPGECLSGFCGNGHCCLTGNCNGDCADCSSGTCTMPADDVDCGAISCAGLNQDCQTYTPLTSNRCLAIGQCRSPNDPTACPANRVNAPAWTECGTGPCMACDANGSCVETPADDADCGTIPCENLESSYQCRDFQNMTTNRCAAFGTCQTPNTAYCTSYSDNHDWCPACEKCVAGSCLPQTTTEDIKDDCRDDMHSDCGTGFCNNNSACDVEPIGTACDDGCTGGPTCDGAGYCQPGCKCLGTYCVGDTWHVSCAPGPCGPRRMDCECMSGCTSACGACYCI